MERGTSTADEETFKKANKHFMTKIRELDEKYYPGILKITALCALLGAALGGGGGARVGAYGAAIGAILGVVIGGAGGFFTAGYHAVKKYQRDQ